MSVNKSMSQDLEKLQKRLEIYEDRVLSPQAGEDVAYLKEMVTYYREETKRVRDAVLEFSKLASK